jgi:phage terminase large subunit
MAIEKHKLHLKGSPILNKLIKAQKNRFIILEGSARSTKTFSLCQHFILKGLEEQNKIFTVSRKTRPALKASAEKDFVDFLKLYDIYEEDKHNKTVGIYFLNSNIYYFNSVDQSTKIKGRRHNYVWMNEADEFFYNDFVQFNLRLTNPSLDGRKNQLFLDFNPPDDDHWLYTRVYERPESLIIPSTYLDNPFLDEDSIREIEALEESDPEYWQVYGLGKRAIKLEKIYPHHRKIPVFPEMQEVAYGLDFGFNHPTALVKCGYTDGVGLVWQQEIYQSYLTGKDIIALMIERNIQRDVMIWADPSRPDLISEISDAGFTIEAAENDVSAGIGKVKAAGLSITEESEGLLKEAKKYSWKKNPHTMAILDQPVKLWDDGMDAGRYGSYHLITGSNVIKSPRSKLIRRNRR